MPSALKRVIKSAAVAVLRRAPLDGLLAGINALESRLAGLILFRDWSLLAYGRPQFFKHRIDLARWDAEPHRWSFAARGVYAREKMFRGCTVLDLCCGDGTYSRLFFSDVASKIDAVDNDRFALGYARRYNTAAPISYHEIDIVSQPLPDTRYDIVVWNAAICYFEQAQIRNILGKIVRAGKPGMRLCGMLPKAAGYVDHKTEFADARSVEALLEEYFDAVTVREVDEISAVTFYFSASEARLETA
jgi:SAM-dependent methyltransferase